MASSTVGTPYSNGTEALAMTTDSDTTDTSHNNASTEALAMTTDSDTTNTSHNNASTALAVAGPCDAIVHVPSKDDLKAMVDPTEFHVMPSLRKKPELSKQLMPPPPKRKKRKPDIILEEDEFAEEIRRIVVRDFFPDLPKLEAQFEWLKATENNDVERLRELRAKFSMIQTPNYSRDTPLRSPSISSNNPSSTPVSHRNGDIQNATDGGTPIHVNANLKSIMKSKVHIGLDQFLSQHNGEDNASFEEILERDQLKHKEKYWWVFDDVEKAGKGRLTLADGMIVKAPSEKGMKDAKLIANLGAGGWAGDDRKGVLTLWKYRNKNALMFNPTLDVTRDQCGLIPLEDRQSIEPVRDGPQNFREPKAILHRNTRFVVPMRNSSSGNVENEDEMSIPKSSRSSRDGDRKEYTYLTTPSMEPGEDLTPLMTWGKIDGTPMILGPTDTPIDISSANDFKIVEPDAREKAARRMDVKLRKRKRDKERHKRSLSRRRNSSMRATPRSFSRKRTGITSMSPAARRIASNLVSPMTGGLDFDSQLRASYTRGSSLRRSSRNRSKARVSSSLRRDASRQTPSGSPASFNQAARSHSTPKHSSVTDNLLNID